ncbi:hypothetical protein FW778_00815 [Ginsengibacter hankyongi]|uniref:Uncharacterized protein n=1 Tax=Ginsengibacter hankyongi TaxID=2607284 RepID=A0A5J5II79_9BACT|nr:hypothetical protein [Ginsengibacter hankyongi]KAA9040616.1 hypothetical protein FW778_00815 [Ginsengibacter hankyongi]
MQQKEIDFLYKNKIRNSLYIKILAHITSILVCGFFASFIIGIGLPDIMKMNFTHITLFNLLLALPLLGYVIVLFRENIGAIVMLLGGIALMIYHSYYRDIDMAFIFGLPFIICALLFFWHLRTAK